MTVKVFAIEFGNPPKLALVQDFHAPFAVDYQDAPFLQVFETAVGMDRRDAARFGIVSLEQRYGEISTVVKVDHPASFHKLADKMRYAAFGVQASQAEDPFSMLGRVEQCREPEGTAEMRMVFDQFRQIGVRKFGKNHFRQRTEIVVEAFHRIPVEIDEIAGDVDSDELPFPPSVIKMTKHYAFD